MTLTYRSNFIPLEVMTLFPAKCVYMLHTVFPAEEILSDGSYFSCVYIFQPFYFLISLLIKSGLDLNKQQRLRRKLVSRTERRRWGLLRQGVRPSYHQGVTQHVLVLLKRKTTPAYHSYHLMNRKLGMTCKNLWFLPVLHVHTNKQYLCVTYPITNSIYYAPQLEFIKHTH